MAKKEKGMTQTQKQVYDQISAFGVNGCSLNELGAAMNLSRPTLYRHTEPLHQMGLIKKVKQPGSALLHYVAENANSMHYFPGMGDLQPPVAASSYLVAWSKQSTLNYGNNVKYAKQFPYLVSRLPIYAARYNEEEGAKWPSRAEIEETRKALVLTAEWANYLYNMANSLLNNPRIWDRRKSYGLWFEDMDNAFSEDIAKAIHAKLTELMETVD